MHRRLLIRTVTVLLLASLIVAMLPVGQANIRQYGTLVGESTADSDTTGLLLVNLAAATLMYNDVDNSGTPNYVSSSAHDVFYLSIAGGATVAANDIRLSKQPSGTGAAGAQVKSSDSDRGNTLVALAGAWAYEDIHTTGNGKTGVFNLGEPLYLDVNNDLVVSTGDVKVLRESSSDVTAGSAAWSFVTATDSRSGNALTALAGFQYAVYDTDGDGVYTTDDGVVLDTDANNMITPGDVRLTKVGALAAGMMPKLGEALTFHRLLPMAAAAFAFADSTNAGVVDDNEAIYIDADGSNTVTVDDIRVGPVTATASTTSGAGDHVKTGNADIGAALTAQGTLRYRDNNGNAVYDAEDDLYLDIGGASTTAVEAGDLRLARGGTASGTPGSRVKATETDFNDPLLAVAGASIRFLDFDGGAVYGKDDAVYLDADSGSAVTPGDVRLGKGSGLATFGQIIKQTNTDSEACFAFTFAGAQAGWIDESNPGSASLDETIYLDRSASGAVAPYDVRLSAGGPAAAGTFVAPGSSDVNNLLNTFATALPFLFHDSNGDGSYSVGTGTQVDDTVYLDADASGTVTVADVRITKASVGSGAAGTRVQSGNDDLNVPLTALPAGFAIRGFDIDGNGIFNSDDALYINVDQGARPAGAVTDTSLIGLGCATVGDLRLSGSGGSSSTGGSGGNTGGNTGGTNPTPTQTTTPTATSSPSPTTTATPSASATETPTGTTDPSETPDDTSDPQPTGDGEDGDTPGPAVPLILLVLAAFLLLVRRR